MLTHLRKIILVLWIIGMGTALYFYFFEHAILNQYVEILFGSSLTLACAAYLFIGFLRGLTLIPITYFILLGLLFIPPLPLFILTILGIAVSSTTIYFFSEFLKLDDFFENKYPVHIARLHRAVRNAELPIIIGWSFFPLAPTDVICYVCGALRIDFKKFIFGVLVGEGIACALYIFLGKRLFDFLLL